MLPFASAHTLLSCYLAMPLYDIIHNAYHMEVKGVLVLRGTLKPWCKSCERPWETGAVTLCAVHGPSLTHIYSAQICIYVPCTELQLKHHTGQKRNTEEWGKQCIKAAVPSLNGPQPRSEEPQLTACNRPAIHLQQQHWHKPFTVHAVSDVCKNALRFFDDGDWKMNVMHMIHDVAGQTQTRTGHADACVLLRYGHSEVGSVYCQQRDVIFDWGDTGMRHNCSTAHIHVMIK